MPLNLIEIFPDGKYWYVIERNARAYQTDGWLFATCDEAREWAITMAGLHPTSFYELWSPEDGATLINVYGA